MATKKSSHRTIKVQFEKGESREETLLGRDYLVVPCIAMVEGVRFGANQSGAELGLATEFGDLPILWANRPLVLNHPQIGDEFVSANIPEVLEDYQFGVTMNPELKDNKLHLEAWIDLERVKELGGEFEEVLQRIKDEEDVEVSVGFFCEVEKSKGKFRGQAYSGIWRNIKPDHLAVLSEGIIGACSVKDGCGIPRINQTSEVKMAKTLKQSNSQAQPNPTTASSGCGCGGVHAEAENGNENENNDELDDTPVTQKGLKKILGDLLKPFVQSEVEKVLEAHVASGLRTQREQIVAQAVAPHMMDGDVRKIISQALTKKHGIYNTYLLGFNQEVAVFEKYTSDLGYQTYQVGINVSEGSIEFVGEEEAVILQTKIIPQNSSEDETTTQQEENDMSDEDKSKTKQTTQEQPTAQASGVKITQDPAPQVQNEVKVQSVDEYIASAPPEVREMLEASMKVHSEKKNALIDRIFKAPTNKFTEEFLKTQSVEVLENMASLLPGSYKGLSVVNNTSNPRVQEESGEEGVTVPRPQYAWGSKKKEGAA